MTAKNLWGELKLDEPLRTPTLILKEQSAMLTQLTQGILSGELRVSQSSKGLYIEMYIAAPAVNYFFEVLSVRHGVADLYPLRVQEDGASESIRCENEEEFLETLAQILGSDRIGRVIRSLVAQSKAA